MPKGRKEKRIMGLWVLGIIAIALPLEILQTILTIPFVPFVLLYEHVIQPLIDFFGNISL